MSDLLRSYPLHGFATPANGITLTRIALTPLLAFIVLGDVASKGTSWSAFGIGLLMAVTDLVDGRVARATNSFSRSGAFLDPLADKIVILGVGFAFVAVDRVALLPMLLIALRELAVSAWRIRFALRGAAIPARPLAKWKATVQGAALLAAALPLLEDRQLVVDVAIWFAVLLTVYTGVRYLSDGESATRAG